MTNPLLSGVDALMQELDLFCGRMPNGWQSELEGLSIQDRSGGYWLLESD